ncbi:hypothetical protein OG21DRAFT_1485546 [Imleria badia]|nr:hypothetical protein OG21DRAFT_1485546 [Imleria badia]
MPYSGSEILNEQGSAECIQKSADSPSIPSAENTVGQYWPWERVWKRSAFEILKEQAEEEAQ